MEGVTANAYRGWRAYWKRRGYERLNGSDTGSRNNKQRRKSAHVVELSRVDAHTGDRGGRRRLLGRWRLKLRRPKIRFVLSPKKWLTKLRDAYVNMMMSIGNSGAYYGGGFTGSVDYGGFGRPAIKEYDEKMIVEIYKSIVMAQGQIVPHNHGKVSSQMVWSCKPNFATF